jgi:hypothetical protein
VGCFTASPFGGWGNFGFLNLVDLYAADEGALLPYMTGFPQYTVVTIFSDPVPASCGTWCKTAPGNGLGNWTQVSTQTLASIAGAVANAQAVATTQAGLAVAAQAAASASATSASASAATATSEAGIATTQATNAAASAASALASAQAAGTTGAHVFATHALAAAAAAGLANNTPVQVIADETRSGDYTGYTVTSGALVFAVDFSHPSDAIVTFIIGRAVALGLVLAA